MEIIGFAGFEGELIEIEELPLIIAPESTAGFLD